MHFCSPSFAECTGACLQSRPGGENIINHQDRFAVESRRRLDRPADVAAPFRGREPGLARAPLHPASARRVSRLAAGARQSLRQPRRLVEAARCEARPVHRRRRKEIGLRQRPPPPHAPSSSRTPASRHGGRRASDPGSAAAHDRHTPRRRARCRRRAFASAQAPQTATLARRRQAAESPQRRQSGSAKELQLTPKLRPRSRRGGPPGVRQQRTRRPNHVRQARDQRRVSGTPPAAR